MKPAVERRKARRRPILGTFSLFAVLPMKGLHRLQVHDISELGIGFDVDTEGEAPEDFPIAVGDLLEVHFYLNQSLYLPLSVRVARVVSQAEVRSAGAEFVDRESKHYKAFHAFLTMLDCIIEAVQMVPAVQAQL